MKKIVCLVLVLAVALGLCACGGESQNADALPGETDALLQNDPMAPSGLENATGAVLNEEETTHETTEPPVNAVYEAVKEALSAVSDGVTADYYNPETNEQYSGNGALAAIYADLQALRDYKDCKQMLSCFTVYPNLKQSWITVTTDNMGNEEENVWGRPSYIYNSKGRLDKIVDALRLSRDDLVGRIENASTWQFVYGENDQMAQIRYIDSGDKLVALSEFTYDAAGNVVKETVKDNYGTKVYTYAYDGQGRLCEQMRESGSVESKRQIYKIAYTYDDLGRLIERVYTRQLSDNGAPFYLANQETAKYSYDENNHLKSGEFHSETMNEYGYVHQGYTDRYSYVCDAQGNVLTMTVVPLETSFNGVAGDPTYQKTVHTYTYGDWYVYNPAE